MPNFFGFVTLYIFLQEKLNSEYENILFRRIKSVLFKIIY